jgi:hypothetical protein
MERAMEQVRKDQYSTLCKHLPICDPSLGVDFLREIQVHYDMNSNPKIVNIKAPNACLFLRLGRT